MCPRVTKKWGYMKFTKESVINSSFWNATNLHSNLKLQTWMLMLTVWSLLALCNIYFKLWQIMDQITLDPLSMAIMDTTSCGTSHTGSKVVDLPHQHLIKVWRKCLTSRNLNCPEGSPSMSLPVQNLLLTANSLVLTGWIVLSRHIFSFQWHHELIDTGDQLHFGTNLEEPVTT
jgi:hypothetical protein